MNIQIYPNRSFAGGMTFEMGVSNSLSSFGGEVRGWESAISYDSEVLDWVSRVVANGGSVSQGTKDAANTFMLAIKAANIRSLIYRLNLYAGTGLEAAAVPLIKDKGATLDTLTNFVSGDYSEATGLTGNTTTKFNNTGLTTAELITTTSQSFALYVRTGTNTAALDIGVLTGPGTEYSYLAVSNSGNTYLSMGQNSVQIGPVTDSNGTGFYLGSRNGTGGKLYKNGSEIGTSANMGAAIQSSDTITIYVHATRNQGGGAAFAFSDRAMGGYQIGAGFDATQQSDCRNAWQTFQTALGRNV